MPKPWELTRAQFGVPEAPIDTQVSKLPRLMKKFRENPEGLNEADLKVIKGVKQEQAAHSKFLRLHKVYLEKSNEHFRAVRDAVERGEDVPEKVIDDYPSFASKVAPKESVTVRSRSSRVDVVAHDRGFPKGGSTTQKSLDRG